MALYVIKRISIDGHRFVQEVVWAEADGSSSRYIGAEQRIKPEDLLAAMDLGHSIQIAAGTGGWLIADEMLVRHETPEGRRLRLREHDEDAQHRIELYSL